MPSFFRGHYGNEILNVCLWQGFPLWKQMALLCQTWQTIALHCKTQIVVHSNLS